ncbi:MAG: hotdog domain-containing protein [Acidimicrobiales bacterium]
MPTYPPPNQVLSALGIEVAWTDPETASGRTLVDWTLLGRQPGPPGVGSLMAVVDLVAGSLAAKSVGGDWLVTSDVWMYERAPVEGGPIELQARMLRNGKRSTVVAVEVIAAGRASISSTIEFSRIRREATSLDTGRPGKQGEWVRLGSGPLLDVPLEQACGFRIVDAGSGIVEIDRGEFVNNSIGTLQGGVIALLADVSAATLIGPDARTVDLHFRFLDQTGDGPARATAELIRVDDAGATVKVEIIDVSTGRLVAWANCRVQ